MKKLRVGVIGVGYLGTFHAEKYERMKDVDLVGVVDIDKTRAEKVAKALSTNPYQDHRDLIDKVDAVSIVAPTPAHFSISKDFLENDVDVLIEKPMTTTLVWPHEVLNVLLISVQYAGGTDLYGFRQIHSIRNTFKIVKQQPINSGVRNEHNSCRCFAALFLVSLLEMLNLSI